MNKNNITKTSGGNYYFYSEKNNIILFIEVEEGKSWLRIRNQAPCSTCIYQWLCPPPSDYEIVIGRPNLCHINNK
jgi:pseudo-rSAM protein